MVAHLILDGFPSAIVQFSTPQRKHIPDVVLLDSLSSFNGDLVISLQKELYISSGCGTSALVFDVYLISVFHSEVEILDVELNVRQNQLHTKSP